MTGRREGKVFAKGSGSEGEIEQCDRWKRNDGTVRAGGQECRVEKGKGRERHMTLNAKNELPKYTIVCMRTL